MSKFVAPSDEGARSSHSAQSSSLYAADGGRKYLNLSERQRVVEAVAALDPEKALLALTLVWSGARVSEVLALSPASFQIERGIVAFRTLKRRRHFVREVPLPPGLIESLNRHFGLAALQRDPELAIQPLWRCHRTTAWRLVKEVMHQSGISGRAACPRGLRHSFGVGTVQAGAPLNLVQRWLGHARLSTTAIYTEVSGPEEQAFAERFWRQGCNLKPTKPLR